ncbi:MAG: homocysteine S-methyltransferase family protein [Gammaproteobacteria bacterium]|nr:homocysteine S-methyltransferase family protein [Gammaproteobacteria bacterium]
MNIKRKTNFKEMVESSKVILTEGGMVERINRDPVVELDPYIAHSCLIYEKNSREVLTRIYKEYIDIAREHRLPMLTMAPTWRANPERIEKSAFSHYETINEDCVRFLEDIREGYDDFSQWIYIGGLMCCKGDAYNPAEALTVKEAALFHKKQADSLARCRVDFIKATTLPAVSEARGIAETLSKYKIPYILSFVIDADGAVLDSTPLHKAIDLIDSQVHPAPIFYMVNCVHPTLFLQGMNNQVKTSPNVKKRVLGLQANTSAKSPEELDNLSYLDTTDPGKFADLILSIQFRLGTKVLGGCCGSDNHHIMELAKKLAGENKNTGD